jgi:predicted GIY-YIG superfamily endonuclease
MHYVYILKLTNHAKHSHYIGFSNDLQRRFKEHYGHNEKAELIYYEAYQTEALARTRERKLKQYGSAWRGLEKRSDLN